MLHLALVKQTPDRLHWIVFATSYCFFFLLSISLHMVATVCQLWPEDSSDLHFTGTELTFCQALSHTHTHTHPTHTH